MIQALCELGSGAIELETATGQMVKVYCFKRVLEKIKHNDVDFDMIIMNNDLSAGIPEELKQIKIPIFPSIHAGWHAQA